MTDLLRPSPPRVLDGRKVAQHWGNRLKPVCELFGRHTGMKPGLGVVRVGCDPASQLYIQKKFQAAQELGIHLTEHVLMADDGLTTIHDTLHALNTAPHIHGIIVQLPLPWHLQNTAVSGEEVVELISPHKDVDGLHPLNRGRLWGNGECFVPCTPLGCLKLLEAYDLSPAGKHVVVMGRSILVGRPLAALMVRQNATVTLVHSHTPSSETLTRQGDFLFVATGKRGLVTQNFLKPGGVVVDIGIHHDPAQGRGHGIVGDVDPQALYTSALKAFSPVPGGIGPLTVMGLMHNTLKAAFQQHGLTFPL